MTYREWLQSELTALREDGELEREEIEREVGEALVGRRQSDEASDERVFKVNPDEYVDEASEDVIKRELADVKERAWLYDDPTLRAIERKAITIARSKFGIPDCEETRIWQITQVWLQAKDELLTELWDRNQVLIALARTATSKGKDVLLVDDIKPMLKLILDGATHAA